MEFARVHGRIVSIPGTSEWRLIVSLESNRAVKTVRDEAVSLLESNTDLSDVCWSLDQLTQETIATTLAEHGWEPIGLGSESEFERCESEHSITYVARKL